MDLEAIRREFVGTVFDETRYTPEAEALAVYARACGELAPQFTDPNDADFQAAPTFASSLHAGRRLPQGFPKLPGLGMDGGKAVTNHAPIRPGTTLIGRSHIEDVYAKSGRSGTMTFIVLRMNVYSDGEELLATADTSMVIREKPAAKSGGQGA